MNQTIPYPEAARTDSGAFLRWLPAIGWLRSYQAAWLRADIVAGITLAAYLLPAGIADASLANLPPQAGIYACLFSGLVFWIFCSSRHTAITVTSAISLLIGFSLGEIAGGDASRFVGLAAATALLVAAISFIAWAVKAGAIVHFISESVMVGFKCGVALFLASAQMPKLFGFSGTHGGFWERAGYFLRHINETNFAALTTGLVALTLLILGKIYLKNRPVALFVLVGGIVVAAMVDLEQWGVKLLGEVPQGIPMPSLPAVHWSDINDLLPLAMACFLLGAVETAAIGRMFVAKHGGRLDANQELLGLASANLAAGLGHGFPVSGGMSQSVVNESGGAKSPLSGLIGALILIPVVLFFTGLLKYLPQPVLAAIVLVAISGLFKLDALKHLRRTDRLEYVVAIAALLGVLGSGLLRGVLIGAIISMVLVIRRASRPHVAVLARVPGTNLFSDIERHPENERVPGVLVVRPESGLLYFNVEHVCDVIRDRVRVEPSAPQIIVINLESAPFVDMQAAHALADLADEFVASGARVELVEARASVRDRLKLENVESRFAGVNVHAGVADAIAHADAGAR